MSVPDADRIAELLHPYIPDKPLSKGLISSLEAYLHLILMWNVRINLTSVRDPEELIQRQIGESLFAARAVPRTGSLLDFGSGAGLPGIPIQLVHHDLRVTLAESQGKKASFLREAVRSLGLPCSVWADRVEGLPHDQVFDTVIMRAVDSTVAMLPVAAVRVATNGSLVRFVASRVAEELPGWHATADWAVPLSMGRLLRLERLP